MNDHFDSTTFPDDPGFVTEPAAEQMERHWSVLLGVGIVAFVLGAVLALWPGETVAVVAFLLAFQFLVTGSAQMFLALVSTPGEGARRWAVALAGLLSVVVGLLLLLNPLQTLSFIGWAAGLCVVVVGLADLLGAVVSRTSRHRGWRAVRGLVGLGVGFFLVADPHRSLGLLVLLTCVWLVSYGIVTVFAALVLRSEYQRRHQAPDESRPPSAEGVIAPSPRPEQSRSNPPAV